MRLPGTENWDPVQVRRVIEFERNVARALPTLIASMAPASDYAEPEFDTNIAPNDRQFALVRAAELAFVTDQIELGLEICVELLQFRYGLPKTVMQAVQWASIGSALGRVKVRLDASGAQISTNVNLESRDFIDLFKIPWPETASQTVSLARRLIPAASASGEANEQIRLMPSQVEGRGHAAVAMIELTDEFAAALIIDGQMTRNEQSIRGLDRAPTKAELNRLQNSLFETFEASYLKRINMMRRTPMWNNLRVRGNLIDWSLLLFWISRLRHKNRARATGPRINELVFVRDLARKLAKL